MCVKYMTLFLSLFCSVLFANPIVDEFLEQDSQNFYLESTVKLQESNLEYIEKIRVDAQYREDEEGTAQESVAVRLYPKSFKHYDLEKKNLEHNERYLHIGMQREKLRLQEENYKLLVDAKFQKRMVAFFAKSIELYQNEFIMKQKLMDEKFYVESIFFIKHKIELLKLKQQRIEQSYRGSVRAIMLALNGKYAQNEVEQAIEEYPLMDSAIIIHSLENFDFTSMRKQGIDKKLEEEKVNLVREKLELEKMKEDFKLDFIELGYKNRENHGNSFTVGIGVDLPLSHSNRLNIMKEKLLLSELAEKDKLDEQRYARQVTLILSEAKRLYSYKQGLEDVLSNDTFYKLYAQKEDADPRFMLEVQERNLNSEEEVLEVEEQLHHLYIKLLVLTHGFQDSYLHPSIKEVL